MERLNKFLANSCVCSRRKADEHILAGDVKVNGVMGSELGVKINPEKDVVEFGFINENKILLSNTNFIYSNPLFSNSFALPFLACLPNSTDHLISFCSSEEFNCSNISCFQDSSFALDSIQERTNADQFISENLFICSLTSSGIDNVIDTMRKHKYVELLKSLGFEDRVIFEKIFRAASL